MDAVRFDSITKLFASRYGRRAMLRRMAGAAGIALTGTAQVEAAKPTHGHCPTGTRRCPGSRGACVDLQTDPKNCGACGNDCASCHSCGGECCAGVCGLCFAAGQVCCDGSYCAPLSPTMTACEICGHPCAAGEVCCPGTSACSVGGVC